MSLQVWLPLNQDLRNNGVSDLQFSLISTNTAINTEGKTGKCYNNNSNSAGGIVSDKIINLGIKQSMFCWFKFTSLMSSSSLGGAMITQHRYQKNTGMGLTIKYISSTTGYLSINTGTGSARTYNTYCNTTLLQANTWYHGGYTYDGEKIKIYLNGVCENTVNFTNMSTPADYLAIFCWSFDANSITNVVLANYKLNGSINDVRIYDHCLSIKEVKELSRGLILHYPLDNNGMGNENLFKNTEMDTSQGFIGNDSTDWTVPFRYYNGSVSIHTFENNTDTILLNSARNLGIAFQRKATDINLDSTSYYTISCEAKCSKTNAHLDMGLSYYTNENSWVWRGGANPKYFISSNVWQKFTWTFKPDANTQYIMYCFTVVGTSGGTDTFSIRNCKLEKGEKATPWCPNKEDLSYGDNIIIYDTSGNGYNGSITGKLTTDSDTPRYISSTTFTSNVHINRIVPLPNPTNVYTFSWWGKCTRQGMMWGYGDGNRLNLYFVNEKLYWNTGDGANNPFVDITSTSQYTDNNWHHYAITSNGTTVKLYIDGEFKSNAKIFKAITGTNIFFNGWTNSTTYNFNGSLNDFKLYATCLTEQDIKDLYNISASIDNKGNLYGYSFIEE